MPLRVPVGPIDLVYTKSQRHSVYVTEKSPSETPKVKIFSGRYFRGLRGRPRENTEERRVLSKESPTLEEV